MASAGWVFETAISVMLSTGLPAERAALSIRDRTSASRFVGDASSMAAAIGSAMQRRQPLPRLWLMTDERQGDALWEALERLPRGAGIVFRHYGLSAGERRRLFEQVRKAAR